MHSQLSIHIKQAYTFGYIIIDLNFLKNETITGRLLHLQRTLQQFVFIGENEISLTFQYTFGCYFILRNLLFLHIKFRHTFQMTSYRW